MLLPGQPHYMMWHPAPIRHALRVSDQTARSHAVARTLTGDEVPSRRNWGCARQRCGEGEEQRRGEGLELEGHAEGQ